MIPSDPVAGLVDRYLIMFVDELSLTGFTKILELKGMRKNEQSVAIELLQGKVRLGEEEEEEESRLTKTEKFMDDFTKIRKTGGKWINKNWINKK